MDYSTHPVIEKKIAQSYPYAITSLLQFLSNSILFHCNYFVGSLQFLFNAAPAARLVTLFVFNLFHFSFHLLSDGLILSFPFRSLLDPVQPLSPLNHFRGSLTFSLSLLSAVLSLQPSPSLSAGSRSSDRWCGGLFSR